MPVDPRQIAARLAARSAKRTAESDLYIAELELTVADLRDQLAEAQKIDDSSAEEIKPSVD
jgi:hypothetical protein